MHPLFLKFGINALEQPPYTSPHESLDPSVNHLLINQFHFLFLPQKPTTVLPYLDLLPNMTRAQQTISFGLLVSSLYLALYLQLIPLPPVVQEQVVPVLPFWALVSFGALLLFRLGLGVFTFNDVPDAHKELMSEIDQAKVDLRKLGVDVD
ncbi:hypothetical protein NLG97_g2601 [Lecanicillium saksenae]|uniref:Uncharacterized protein n=1 Tax=Lecanicillium saksenae TaxID=468837 RepID=A0ACC1R0F8_9HYPO|nr:hypothetical protein NLG97_g2601 [Lecanicillium saksenae]